jgi:Holliday junction resolvase
MVEIMPSYEGGAKQLMKDISKIVKFDRNINGTVWVKVKIDQSGKLSILKVEKGISLEIDGQITEALTELQNWIPGKNHGANTSALNLIPIEDEGGKVQK